VDGTSLRIPNGLSLTEFYLHGESPYTGKIYNNIFTYEAYQEKVGSKDIRSFPEGQSWLSHRRLPMPRYQNRRFSLSATSSGIFTSAEDWFKINNTGVKKMKNTIVQGLAVLAVMGLAACVGERPKPAMVYYHGLTPQDVYFEVVGYTPQEIEFKIRVNFTSKYMYHLILEDNEPLAEGWHVTILSVEKSYPLIMKAKEGVVFEPGKKYRLCIGNKSPEYVARYRSAYQCAADYEFVLPQK